jgi:hypothetical protein
MRPWWYTIELFSETGFFLNGNCVGPEPLVVMDSLVLRLRGKFAIGLSAFESAVERKSNKTTTVVCHVHKLGILIECHRVGALDFQSTFVCDRLLVDGRRSYCIAGCGSAREPATNLQRV